MHTPQEIQKQYAHLPELLLPWYQKHARDLPWRRTKEPYRVWVSEIMLQQTRVEAVRGYYERFLTALPDIASLGSASEETLLKLWEGLGYYSRVRNLQKAAKPFCRNTAACFRRIINPSVPCAASGIILRGQFAPFALNSRARRWTETSCVSWHVSPKILHRLICRIPRKKLPNI